MNGELFSKINWPVFWYWVVVSALTLYFGLAFAITVGGFFDVKKMFRRLTAAQETAREPAATGSPGEGSHLP